ncbi:MAG: hypothetical protein A2W00_08775 [Candidatus Eisenbacteria bacterium RBG_16_71_46]|nr:MAG: hypothetical protein A2W00_08775 [Candidatus Eisenbacteria bacterium RBG_16_71_46]
MAAPAPPPPTATPPPPSRGARALLGVLAFAVFTPTLALQPIATDLQVLYWARASALDPRWLLDPWYSGLLGRFVSKLAMTLVMAVAGPRHEVYQALNLLLHVAHVLLVERLARGWSGSPRTGTTAALLFAVGFGFYGRAVMELNNLSMNLALALTLWAFVEWHARRRARALALWILAIGAHEIIALAPLVALLAPRAGAPVSPERERRLTALVLGGLAVAALAALLPVPGHAVAVRLVELPGFALVPVNLGPALDLRLFGLAAPRAVAAFLDAHRLGVGLALLLPIALATSRSAVARFATAWMFLFWLPAAVVMVRWTGGWLDMRYLEVAAVGACLLAALALDRVPARRARGALLAVLIAWSLLVMSFVWLKQWRVPATSEWQRKDREFRHEMRELDRTRVPVRGGVDSTRAD